MAMVPTPSFFAILPTYSAQHTDGRKHFGWRQNWHLLHGWRQPQNVTVLFLPPSGS